MDRPLPDERPRASVANLIGRFEQVKRPSAPEAGTAPLVAQSTGGSVTKKWPPVHTATPPAPSTSPRFQSSRSPSISVSPNTTPVLVIPDDKLTSPSPTVEELPQAVESDAVVEPVKEPTPEAEAPLPEAPPTPPPEPAPKKKDPVATPVRKPATPKTQTPAKPSTPARAKTPSGPTAFKSSRPSVSSTPRSSSTARSPATTIRSPSAAGRHPPPPPAPAQSTPTRPAARPKTPSGGLHAPTAASLARARNAPESGPPKEQKKIALSTRLTQPTAASQSKIREETAPKTPARTGMKVGTLTGRGGRPISTPVKSKSARPSAVSKACSDAVARKAEESTSDDHQTPVPAHSPTPELTGHVDDADEEGHQRPESPIVGHGDDHVDEIPAPAPQDDIEGIISMLQRPVSMISIPDVDLINDIPDE